MTYRIELEAPRTASKRNREYARTLMLNRLVHRTLKANEAKRVVSENFADEVRRARFNLSRNCDYQIAVLIHKSGQRVDYNFMHRRMKHIKADMMERLRCQVYRDKRPANPDMHFGIELEFLSSSTSDELGQAIFDAGLAEHVCLKEDGSIRGYDEGHEVAILVTQATAKDVVTRLCSLLAAHEAYVNKSCGMHVHIDMRNNDSPGSVYRNLINCQTLLYSMNPKSRRENTFCVPESRSWEEASGDTEDRYWGVNASAMERHDTIEIRMHSSTINANKILNWVELLNVIANTKPNVLARRLRTMEGYLKALGISNTTLGNYVRHRVGQFGWISWTDLTKAERRRINQDSDVCFDDDIDDEDLTQEDEPLPANLNADTFFDSVIANAATLITTEVA